MKPLFVFDLDSTITRCELLPLLAQSVDMGREMADLTEAAMQGEAPFEQDFRSRVELLKKIPLPEARGIIAKAPLHEKIAEFIREHAQRCIILSGNLDAWIAPIIENLGMMDRCLCSRALIDGDRLLGVADILDKAAACRDLHEAFIAIGDGSNDLGMIRAAEIGIAFGGARKPPEKLIQAADHVAWNEDELIGILEKYL